MADHPYIDSKTPIIDTTELTRIILASLHSLGYTATATTLELESGVSLDSPEFSSLFSYAISGQFHLCDKTLLSIPNLNPAARFLLWRQQFLELIGSNDLITARNILSKKIAPLDVSRKAIHRLAKVIVTAEGAVVEREKILRRIDMLVDLAGVLPPWVRVTCGRLEQLVETVVVKQIESCLYHNLPEEVSLYQDHCCTKESIPSECVQTLHDHKNEVWFVQFSNRGEYLASSSKDCTAIIWKVGRSDRLSLKHVLKGHERPVSFLTWSPDDTMLLTCGNCEVLKLWDVDAGVCMLTFKSAVNRVISSCAWYPSSDKIVCGSYQPNSRIYTCDLKGNELEVWEGERIPKVSDLAVTPDGNNLISICSNQEIWIHNFQNGKEHKLNEEHWITSLSLSRDGQFLIVNLNSEEIHLWSLNERSRRPYRFRGHKQGQYVIRSCFGGTNSRFIASGSEDSQVYIWRLYNELPILVLSGHSSTVNCVSWNLAKPHLLVSASDDGTIRVWAATEKSSRISAH